MAVLIEEEPARRDTAIREELARRGMRYDD